MKNVLSYNKIMKNSYKSDYVDYSPFWQLLERKRITQYQLINQFNVNSRTLTKLRKGGNLNIYTISDLCLILNCRIEHIVRIPEQHKNVKSNKSEQ